MVVYVIGLITLILMTLFSMLSSVYIIKLYSILAYVLGDMVIIKHEIDDDRELELEEELYKDVIINNKKKKKKLN